MNQTETSVVWNYRGFWPEHVLDLSSMTLTVDKLLWVLYMTRQLIMRNISTKLNKTTTMTWEASVWKRLDSSTHSFKFWLAQCMRVWQKCNFYLVWAINASYCCNFVETITLASRCVAFNTHNSAKGQDHIWRSKVKCDCPNQNFRSFCYIFIILRRIICLDE